MFYNFYVNYSLKQYNYLFNLQYKHLHYLQYNTITDASYLIFFQTHFIISDRVDFDIHFNKKINVKTKLHFLRVFYK